MPIETFQILIGGAATLAIFSFLFKENRFYRFFEHLYLGVATAISTMAVVKTFIWPKVIVPLFGLNRIIFPDGTYAEPYNYNYLFLLLPIVFGLLYYFILSPRFSWLAQLVIGFQLGVSAGLAFQGTFNEMLPQIYDSFRPLYVPGDAAATFSNLFFIAAMAATFMYFFFTFKRKPGGPSDKVAWFGRSVMMGCFGAFFGSTIMARMALLVERLEFLINRFFPVLKSIFASVFYYG
jgi:hypothetical protein